MLYVSTRGHADRKRFCEILLEGLAPDGGLYLPETYPQVSEATLAKWRGLAYADLAFEILSLYVDDIPATDLQAICRKTYTEEVFGTKAIVPLKKLEGGLYLEALSNGPTLAFKDMAMQLLGNLFEYELARRGAELNILGATSGDTGSAAEYAMKTHPKKLTGLKAAIRTRDRCPQRGGSNRTVPSLIRRRNRSPGQMSNGFFDLLAHAPKPRALSGVRVARVQVWPSMRQILP